MNRNQDDQKVEKSSNKKTQRLKQRKKQLEETHYTERKKHFFKSLILSEIRYCIHETRIRYILKKNKDQKSALSCKLKKNMLIEIQ